MTEAPPVVVGVEAQRSLWTRVIVLVAAAATVLALVWALAASLPVALIDFEHYLRAARLIWNAQNPYGTVEFFAPPWAAVWLAPLLWLPARFAAAVWLLLALCALAGTAALTIRWLGFPRSPSRRLAAVILATIVPAAFFVYVTGQVTAVVGLGALGAAWVAADRSSSKHAWLFGPAVFIATTKPHVVGLLLIVGLLDVIRGRNWRALASAALLLVAGAVFAATLLPNWPSTLWRAWQGGAYRGGEGLVSPGFIGLAELGLPAWLLLPLGAYVVVHWAQAGLTSRVIALSLAVGLLLVPYSRAYDHVVLIFPVLYGLARTAGHRLAGVSAALTVGAVLAPLVGLAVAVPALVAIVVLLAPIEKLPAATGLPPDNSPNL